MNGDYMINIDQLMKIANENFKFNEIYQKLQNGESPKYQDVPYTKEQVEQGYEKFKKARDVLSEYINKQPANITYVGHRNPDTGRFVRFDGKETYDYVAVGA